MSDIDHDRIVVWSGRGGSVAAGRATEKRCRVEAELFGLQSTGLLDDVLVLSGAGLVGVSPDALDRRHRHREPGYTVPAPDSTATATSPATGPAR